MSTSYDKAGLCHSARYGQLSIEARYPLLVMKANMAVLAKCHQLLVELKHPLLGPSSSAAKEELLVMSKHSVPVKQPNLCYPVGGQ